MVAKTEQQRALKGGRRSRAVWRQLREAYEDGVALEVLSQRWRLRAATIEARAAAEDWLSPRRALVGLGRALNAEIAGVEAALADGDNRDSDKRARALEGLSRAAERLAALRLAQQSAGVTPPRWEEGEGDGAHAPDQKGEALTELRAALERRLAACLERAGEGAVSGEPQRPGAEGAGDVAEP